MVTGREWLGGGNAGSVEKPAALFPAQKPGIMPLVKYISQTGVAMSTTTLSATEVKNRFGRVLREIAQTGGPIMVERDGKPVAVILSVGEYTRLQPQTDPASKELDLLKASVGRWAGRQDRGEDWLADGRSHWESTWADE